MQLVEIIGDRTEGKPTPVTVAQTKRTTVFREAEHEPASRVEETTETTAVLAPPESLINDYVETLKP